GGAPGPSRADARAPRGDAGSRRGDRHPRRARGHREAGRGRARAGSPRCSSLRIACDAAARVGGSAPPPSEMTGRPTSNRHERSRVEAHRGLVDAYLAELPFADELGELTDAMRYSLEGGGKRIRPVLCLATGEVAGPAAERRLP